MVSDYNIEAEQSVLGSVLIARSAPPKVVGALSLEDWSPQHQPWFLAICSMFRAGKQIDPVTVLGELHDPDDRVNAEHRRYCRELLEITPTVANLDSYLGLIQAQSRMRQFRACAMEVMSSPTEDGIRPAIDRMVSVLGDHKVADVQTFAEGWERFYERHSTGKPTDFITTGFRRLDSRVHIRRGKFVLIGGYPSDGKTALALQAALHMAEQRHRVGFFSLETDHDDLMDRMAACYAGISFSATLENRLTDEDWAKLASASEAIEHLPMDLIHASGYTVEDIRARTKIGGYQIIFIDYTQIISSGRRTSRYDAVTEISMALHNMAQQLGVLIIALSQLTRPPKDKNGKTPPPSMQSLRESGQLEQDADAILLLTEHKDPNDERFKYVSRPQGTDFRQLLVVKNKTGQRRGSIPMWLHGDLQRFEEIRLYDAPQKPEEPKLEQEFIPLPDDTAVPF